MDEHFLRWLLSQPELCSWLLVNFLWLFICLGKKCETCNLTWQWESMIVPSPLPPAVLKPGEPVLSPHPLRKLASKAGTSLEKLPRRHGLWGGREPVHIYLLLHWLLPAVFASEVHAVTAFSNNAFTIAHSMETRLRKAGRPSFKTCFSYDAENNHWSLFFWHSTGLGS